MLRWYVLFLMWLLTIQNQLSHAQSEASVTTLLRAKLLLASRLLASSSPLLSPDFPLNCSCEGYCTGQCFAMRCAPCNASTFSFPGGEGLCEDVGPLGTGLLCHVERNGTLTTSPCCTSHGPTCWLPVDSCCSFGDCSTCPPYPMVIGLFPPLKRRFVNSSSECLEV